MLGDANTFYANIFKLRQRPDGVSMENFLKDLKDKPEVIMKKLTEEEKIEADRNIEEKELKETLDRVSAGKTPGIDGIEKEFLTRYWRMIGTTIADAAAIFVDKEKLNNFLDRGLIKVIQKGDTTGETLNNWRPITLLSQIYKLISGVVAGRMKKLLSKLISGCQKAYQNTANIGEIILDIIETIAICNYHKKPAVILLIDFSKAFDSISHAYIYETLKFFNFGDYFIKIVKTMLTGRTCTVMIDGYETKPFNIERGVPQGDTASPYLFILVLEILLLRIMLDERVTKIKLNTPNYSKEDGGDLDIPVLQCFADDMTCVIEETEKNLVMMKSIFEEFAALSGLEINEKKTKVIRVGSKLDDLKPLTNKVKFAYTKDFRLLGVDLDNKLSKLWKNFEERKKKIRKKIAIWRKLNLSEIGNLIISKTFMISQLGYLLSMMECPKDLMEEIQVDIDRFIFRTGGNPWMAKERRYLTPAQGGMGAIHIETYANSLRCAWAKRIKSGLWSDILLSKVQNPENCCFIQTKDIHKMHISILPIVKAFSTLQENYMKIGGASATMNTPLDQLELVREPTQRRQQIRWKKPTRTTHPALYRGSNICEITGKTLSEQNSLHTSPKMKTDQELWNLLGIENMHFLRKAEILREIKKLYKNLTENKDFTVKTEPEGLPSFFKSVKKGSQKYKKILLNNFKENSNPKNKIEKDWKISEKQGRERYFERAFSFWKTSCLPAKLQLLLLKISNHNLKLNSQLRHYAVDKNGARIKPYCTFCGLQDINSEEKESYKHFFLQCPWSRGAMDPIATKYRIPIPNTDTKGELILYFFPWEGYWDELRINVFYSIYKYYLTTCRTRKLMPSSQHFEATLKVECKNIIMTNPTNKDLVKNLLPLWTERELTTKETLELLEEVEGRTDKGKLFLASNKTTIVIKTQLHTNFRFPILAKDYQIHRANEKKNNDRIRADLL